MNKTIKLDYEEFKELEEKAKKYDDGKILVTIEEISGYFKYGHIYIVSAFSSKEELSEYIKDRVIEVINLDEEIKNIKKSLEEEKVKEVEGIAKHLHEMFYEKETQLNVYKLNADNFVKVQKNYLYKILHFFRLL